nr:reverse transcriptase domain-containing protein [Tanacetum cinerariifolium]
MASPTISFFHDDPYMKVIHVYDTIIPLQVPIPPPTIVPSSLMLSPIFKNSFFSRKYCHQRNKAAAIWQLIDDRVAAAMEAQDANIENTDNTNKNPEPRETLAVRKCTYKEFMSCQPFYFNSKKGAVGLIHWFERTESVFSRSNYTKDCKVKFATDTLTDALSWWNSYAKPIGIEQADKIDWSELKRLLTNKYCPRTEVKKIEDEFYNLVVKENDLKNYARRFQELAVLCPNMVPNTEKLMEVFIGVTKHTSVQGTNDQLRKFDDSGNTDNNYPNTRNNNNHSNNRNNYNRNNDYHQQQNRRPKTVRTYAATPTENKSFVMTVMSFVMEEKVVREEEHDFVSKVQEWPFGKAWFCKMKILVSVLFRKERMAEPRKSRVKVAEKEDTGDFCDSPDGGPISPGDEIRDIEGCRGVDAKEHIGFTTDNRILSLSTVHMMFSRMI